MRQLSGVLAIALLLAACGTSNDQPADGIGVEELSDAVSAQLADVSDDDQAAAVDELRDQMDELTARVEALEDAPAAVEAEPDEEPEPTETTEPVEDTEPADGDVATGQAGEPVTFTEMVEDWDTGTDYEYGWTIIVEDVTCGVDPFEAHDFDTDETRLYEPQGKFCAVTATYENVGARPELMETDMLQIADEEGREYATDYNQVVAYREHVDDPEWYWDEVQPGQSTSGTLIFDLPEDAEPSAINVLGYAFTQVAEIRL